MVAMLVAGRAAGVVAERIRGASVHVPAHFDAEVLSALGRIHRADELDASGVSTRLDVLAAAPFERHSLGPLLAEAWSPRANVRLVDALYIALAERSSAPLITLDKGLAAATKKSELLEIRATA